MNVYNLSLTKGGISTDHSHHSQLESVNLTWDDLVTAVTSGGWTPAVYKDGRRASENFVEANMIGIDYDDGNPSLEQARFLFKDYKHIIYTTKSHQIAKGSKEACDRFRIILFFESTIKNEKDYKKVCNVYKRKFRDDEACHTSARYFAPGKLVSAKEEGKKLEVIMLNENQQKAVAYIKEMGQSIEGQGGDAILAKACKYLRNDFAMSFEESLDVILEWDQNNQPPWQHKHMGAIEAKLRDAIKYADPSKTGRLLKEEVKIENNFSDEPTHSMGSIITGIQKLRDRILNAFSIFHPQFDFKVTKNSYILIGAVTGSGKSTFFVQTVCNAILDGLKVIVITNEETSLAFMERIIQRLKHLNYSEKASIQLILDLVDIFDVERTNGRSGKYDTLIKILDKVWKSGTSDLVIVDQMITAKSTGSVSGVFEGPKAISEYIKGRINSSEVLAPIMVAQQVKAGPQQEIEKVSMKAMLQNSTQTIDDATHALLIQRNEDNKTSFKVCKFREEQLMPTHRITRWIMNDKRWLIPDETQLTIDWKVK